MTIKDNTSNDESIARELQEQFRREVEQYASSSVWNEIHSVFTPHTDVDGSDNEVFEDTVQDIESIPVVDGIPEDHSSSTPPSSKKKCHDLSYSTTSTSPSTSLDGSPFERSPSEHSCPTSMNEFIDVDIDLQRNDVESRKRQQKRDEILARRLEREMRDEALARELRASQEFVVGTVTESDADLARRLQRESEEEARGRRRRRGLGSDATTTQKVIYYGSRILSVVLVICVTYLVFIMVWGKNVNAGLDPASW